MRTPARVALVAALLGLAACGAPAQGNSVKVAEGGAPAVQAASPAQQTVDFGAQYRFSDGVTVLVSAPKSFRPSSSAYPPTGRAVAFEIAIHNDGDQPYRLSALSVSATAAGSTAKQVVDSTQGYSGIVDAGKDVPSGRDVQVTLAFAVPEAPSDVRLSLRPNATSSVVAVYCGSA